MAKKKAKVEAEIPETAEISEVELPAERVYKSGGKAVIVDGGRWHILYTPQWRAQLDFGEVDGTFDEIQKEVSRVLNQALTQFLGLDNPAVLNWQQESDSAWIATGDDGTGETTLPLVRLTKVG